MRGRPFCDAEYAGGRGESRTEQGIDYGAMAARIAKAFHTPGDRESIGLQDLILIDLGVRDQSCWCKSQVR